jgi:rhombotail lipoprotein
MRFAAPARLLFCVSAFVLLALGCAPGSVRRSASVIDYLYPSGNVSSPPQEIQLQLPLRVGIAFVPDGMHSMHGIEGVSQSSLADAFSEPQQRELLKRVAEAFRGTPDVSLVEVLPTHNMKGKGGFDELQPLAAMYGLNLVTLVSYDQVQFDERDASSLLYWTIIGNYLVPGDLHETQTLLDASVFDMSTRALLFSGSGSSIVKGRSTANSVRRELRLASGEGFEKATDDLIANLGISLGVFRENVKKGTLKGLGTPSVQVHRQEVQSAAASAGALGAADLAGVALLALGAGMAARTRRAHAFRMPWCTLGLVAAALCVSFGPDAQALASSLQLERAAFLHGELWRVWTAPLVHGWPQLAFYDLGALLVLGAWVEQRSRRLVVQAWLLASLLSGAAVLVLRPDIGSYQGASAQACALFALCAAQLFASRSALDRGVALAALAGFAAKLVLESGASPLFAGAAPVESLALAHAAGALAGLCVRGPRRYRPSTARIAPAISACSGSS